MMTLPSGTRRWHDSVVVVVSFAIRTSSSVRGLPACRCQCRGWPLLRSRLHVGSSSPLSVEAGREAVAGRDLFPLAAKLAKGETVGSAQGSGSVTGTPPTLVRLCAAVTRRAARGNCGRNHWRRGATVHPDGSGGSHHREASPRAAQCTPRSGAVVWLRCHPVGPQGCSQRSSRPGPPGQPHGVHNDRGVPRRRDRATPLHWPQAGRRSAAPAWIGLALSA